MKEEKKLINQENINTHTHHAREGFEKLGTFHNVVLSPSDIETIKMHLAAEGLGDDFLKRCVDKLSAFMAQNGTHYANHAAAILSWVKTAVLEEDHRTGKAQPNPAAVSSKDTDPEEARLRSVWESCTEQEQQQYRDHHQGKDPMQVYREGKEAKQ